MGPPLNVTVSPMLLISEVRKREPIWNKHHKNHNRKNLIEGLWEEISVIVGSPVSSCKARWNNMRDNFRKSLRKAKHRQNSRKYKYSKQLGFLLLHFNQKEIDENINFKINKEVQQDCEDDFEDEKTTQDDAVNPVVSDRDELTSQPLPTLQRKNTAQVLGNSRKQKPETKKEASLQTAAIKFMKYHIGKNKSPVATTSSSHPVDAFLAGVALTLKTLSPCYLNLAKSEIFASVQKYEMKMLMEQQQRPQENRSRSKFLHITIPHSEHYSNASSPASSTVHSPDQEFEDENSFCSILPNDTGNPLKSEFTN